MMAKQRDNIVLIRSFASSGDSMTNAFRRKVDDVSYLYPFRSRPVRTQFLD